MSAGFKIELELISYLRGYHDGYERRPKPPIDADGLSWSSGYIEGRADRERERESRR